MIVIVEYGLGNLRSILYKLQKLKIDVIISSKIQDIENAEKLILPGVGNFAKGIQNLNSLGLIPVLTRKVIDQHTPIFGICLGMQLFTKKSDEGNAEGLGWIDAETKRFYFENHECPLRIPHVGWNTISIKRESPILEGINKDTRFYFTHSYYVDCKEENSTIATTNYGYDFTSIIQKGNIYGTQFHPEKSRKRSMKIIENFVRNALI